MIHKTKGIILRTVKYGETSLVVTVFTELHGLQSYMVNGVRQTSKKGASKAGYFQPAAQLDLVVYHNEFKNLQRIKEYKWTQLYQHIFSDIIKNAVSLYMIELLTKCLKEPEENPELFYFVEDALLHLDEATPTVTANYPLFFALHLAVFFGFRISESEAGHKEYLDLQEGVFTNEHPPHANYLEGKEAETIAQLLRTQQPTELEDLKLHHDSRRRLLVALENYYASHIHGFGNLKTLPVLREILN